MAHAHDERSTTVRRLLWLAQVVLALLFLFAGGMKLILPVEAMTRQIQLPGTFLRFIGACEVSGALGLVLPGLLRIHEELTPLAAAGLVVIMIGAVSITAATSGVAGALFPLVVGLLAACIAWGRRRSLPSLPSTRAALHVAR